MLAADGRLSLDLRYVSVLLNELPLCELGPLVELSLIVFINQRGDSVSRHDGFVSYRGG